MSDARERIARAETLHLVRFTIQKCGRDEHHEWIALGEGGGKCPICLDATACDYRGPFVAFVRPADLCEREAHPSHTVGVAPSPEAGEGGEERELRPLEEFWRSRGYLPTLGDLEALRAFLAARDREVVERERSNLMAALRLNDYHPDTIEECARLHGSLAVESAVERCTKTVQDGAAHLSKVADAKRGIAVRTKSLDAETRAYDDCAKYLAGLAAALRSGRAPGKES